MKIIYRADAGFRQQDFETKKGELKRKMKVFFLFFRAPFPF